MDTIALGFHNRSLFLVIFAFLCIGLKILGSTKQTMPRMGLHMSYSGRSGSRCSKPPPQAFGTRVARHKDRKKFINSKSALVPVVSSLMNDNRVFCDYSNVQFLARAFRVIEGKAGTTSSALTI